MTQCLGHTARSWDLPFNIVSISPEPLERFSLNFTQMFTLRQCAEPMTGYALKVKVTLHGHEIYSLISCPLHITQTF